VPPDEERPGDVDEAAEEDDVADVDVDMAEVVMEEEA